jgi:dehydrogenase/reductase SDR family protein 12
MVCRNEKTGALAKDQIIHESNNPNVHLHIVDMSRPTQIIRFIQQFPEKKVDILVNNAGAAMDNYQQTPEGLEVTFATNTLGTYLMTERLVKYLKDSQEPRVITVSSGGAYTVSLESKNFMATNDHRFDGVSEYAQTKVLYNF